VCWTWAAAPAWNWRISSGERPTPDGYYHLDIPFSLETQFRLLREAGFATVELLWQAGLSAVYVARKGG
jgi:hypothetical protein